MTREDSRCWPVDGGGDGAGKVGSAESTMSRGGERGEQGWRGGRLGTLGGRRKGARRSGQGGRIPPGGCRRPGGRRPVPVGEGRRGRRPAAPRGTTVSGVWCVLARGRAARRGRGAAQSVASSVVSCPGVGCTEVHTHTGAYAIEQEGVPPPRPYDTSAVAESCPAGQKTTADMQECRVASPAPWVPSWPRAAARASVDGGVWLERKCPVQWPMNLWNALHVTGPDST